MSIYEHWYTQCDTFAQECYGKVAIVYSENLYRITNVFESHSSFITAPGPPQDLTLVNRTCHSITFQWSPPDDTGGLDITGYDILHNGTPVANITWTVYTLEGLTPDTLHTISVRTRNAIGTSVLERTMTAATTQRESGGWKEHTIN